MTKSKTSPPALTAEAVVELLLRIDARKTGSSRLWKGHRPLRRAPWRLSETVRPMTRSMSTRSRISRIFSRGKLIGVVVLGV
jgi:hypothetical protein